MNATEQQVRLAAEMYRQRDAAKMILGPKYAEVTTALGQVIQTIAVKRGIDLLKALILVLQAEEDPNLRLFLTASAVELTEPSR